MAEPIISGGSNAGQTLTVVPGTGYAVVRRRWFLNGADMMPVHENNKLVTALPHVHKSLQVRELDTGGTWHTSNIITVTQSGAPAADTIPANDLYELEFNELWTDGNLARLNYDAIVPAGSSIAWFVRKRWGADQYINGEKQRFTFLGDPGFQTTPFPNGPSTYNPFSINTDEGYVEMELRRATQAELPYINGATWMGSMLRSAFVQKEGWFEMDIYGAPEFWQAGWLLSEFEATPPEIDLFEVDPIARPNQIHVNRHMFVTAAQAAADQYSVQDNPEGTGWVPIPDGRPWANRLHTAAYRQTPDGLAQVYLDGVLVNTFSSVEKVIERLRFLLTFSVPPDYTDWLTPERAETPDSLKWRCYGVRAFQRPTEAARGPKWTAAPTITQGRNATSGDILTSGSALWADTPASLESFWQYNDWSDKLSVGSSSHQTDNVEDLAVFKAEIGEDSAGYQTKVMSLFTWTLGAGEPVVDPPAPGIITVRPRAGLNIDAFMTTALAATSGQQKINYSTDVRAAIGNGARLQLRRDGVVYYEDTCDPIVDNAAPWGLVVPTTLSGSPSTNNPADLLTGAHEMSLLHATDDTIGFDVDVSASGSTDSLILSESADGVKLLNTDLCFKAPSTLDVGFGGVDDALAIAERTIVSGSTLNEADLPGMTGVAGSPAWARSRDDAIAAGWTTHAAIAMGVNPEWNNLAQWIRDQIINLGLNSETTWPWWTAWSVLIATNSNNASNVAVRHHQAEMLGLRADNNQWELISRRFLGGWNQDRWSLATKPDVIDVSEFLQFRQTGTDAVTAYRDEQVPPLGTLVNRVLHPYQGTRSYVEHGKYRTVAVGYKMQLVPWSNLEPDDTGQASFLVFTGADSYPQSGGGLPGWIPGVGTSSGRFLTTNPEWYTYVPLNTMRDAQGRGVSATELRSNPPPFGAL